jgi:hypothetical protein
MRVKTFFLLIGLLFFGEILAITLPGHHPPATPTEVAELRVTIREWAVPTIGAHPHDPAVGPDGSLWFTEQMANKLGRLDPKTSEFKEYPLLEGKNSGPHGLVADHDGNIWFTANFGGYIGKLDPRTGKVTQYPMPSEKLMTRIPPCSMRTACCGLRCKAATWLGSSISRRERSS